MWPLRPGLQRVRLSEISVLKYGTDSIAMEEPLYIFGSGQYQGSKSPVKHGGAVKKLNGIIVAVC
jgi:hypothetical protein